MPAIPLFIQTALAAGEASRASAFNWCNPFDTVLPWQPDGGLSASDRQWLWGLYTGIDAETPTVVTGNWSAKMSGSVQTWSK